METGVFSSIGSSYLSAAKNVFVYFIRVNFLFKPIILIMALVYACFLLPLAIIFYIFIIFDWIGKITDNIRLFFMRIIESNAYKIDSSFFSFLFRPIVIVLFAPIFLASLFIPKLSSSVDVDAYDISDGAGTFKKIQHTFWKATKNLFIYVVYSNILLMPFVAAIAIIYSLILISIGFIFALLIPLDWISRLVEMIRDGIANFSYQQQQKIRYSFIGFLFSTLLLIFLAPLFLALLIIPKFSGELMVS